MKPRARGFATTRWSLVLAAGRPEDPGAGPALEELCSAYWYPLFAWARRRGISDADARDLVQDFFAWLLSKSTLAVADPDRGRFRTFLLTVFSNFLANEHDQAQALKRGGGRTFLPLEDTDGKVRFEPSHDETPERLFDRDWAVTILQRVLDALREEYESRGREDLFLALRPLLDGRGEKSAAEIAVERGTTEGAIRVGLHRLRRRFREELRREIGDTVVNGEDVEDEIRQLFIALGEKSP